MSAKPKSSKENGAAQATNGPQNKVSLCSTLSDAQESVIREIISRATDKWSLWALSELAKDGPLRFSRLMDRVEGVSQKSLTATLRHLERDGLVKRTVTVQVPIRVDYEATPLGKAFIQETHSLWMWCALNLRGFARARTAFDRMGSSSVAI
jgi:DNA-binding HxlR family transcriptional regulator